MVPLNLERELGDLDKTQMPDQWVWGGWGGGPKFSTANKL